MEREGKSEILLNEYLNDKQLLTDKKIKLNHLCNFVTTEYRSDLPEVKESLEEEIKELEKKIRIFVSGLNMQQLKSVIYMSLDMQLDD